MIRSFCFYIWLICSERSDKDHDLEPYRSDIRIPRIQRINTFRNTTPHDIRNYFTKILLKIQSLYSTHPYYHTIYAGKATHAGTRKDAAHCQGEKYRLARAASVKKQLLLSRRYTLYIRVCCWRASKSSRADKIAILSHIRGMCIARV